MSKELQWNVDGHRFPVEHESKSGLSCLRRASVLTETPRTAPCYHAGIESCAVNYFINVYGLETNSWRGGGERKR